MGTVAAAQRSLFIRAVPEGNGLQPAALLYARRLEQAKTELRETDDSVTAISERLGFSSLHYFSRQFAKVQQESPQQYRKRIRGYEA
ncbi:helix-turn-helix domain-containing protein [Paenibacillus sp. P26]|nr:helix-turn-helix domain-containing protein [Paenibacillus sp. P26]